MTGDGSARGRSDRNIDNGMAPEKAAGIILDGINSGRREIVVAEGMELAALEMRAKDPRSLFDFVAEEGARLAAAREAGLSIEPAQIRED